EIQHPRDSFDVGSAFVFPGSQRAGAGLQLGDGSSDNALPNNLLPDVPYSLAAFPFRYLIATFEYPNPGSSSPYTAGVVGSFDRFYAVPEPGTFGALGAGILLILNHREITNNVSG